MYGKQSYSQVSRFVHEMDLFTPYSEPKTSLPPQRAERHEVVTSLNSFLSKSKETKTGQNFTAGTKVFHSKFGVGKILELDSDTKTAKIDFDAFGIKILSLEYAPLKIM